MKTSLHAAIVTAACLLGAGSLRAEVSLPAIFGDHMVLQEGVTIPIWGTAGPSERVTVTLGNEKARTVADAMGKWRLDLPKMPVDSIPLTMTIVGNNRLTFTDVLVGEVWVCSGQSNMEFELNREKPAVGGADDPQLRFFLVKKKTSLEPLIDVSGEWQVCTPTSASLFSAVGYFFGEDLRKNLHRPVGLIGTYWGGTPAQAWTSLEALQKVPILQHYAEVRAQTRANLNQAAAAYTAKLAAYKTALAAWKELPTTKASADSGLSPARRGAPRPPTPPDGGQDGPTNLYNAMIAPLIPFAIKGVIWYQGEANADAGREYATLFPTMITDWRDHWHEGDFPFLFVQLARFEAKKVQSWPFLREAQLKTLSLPNTGMAVTVDIGNPHNVHPTDKVDVGERLALAAMHLAYGEKNLVYSGPIYAGMKVSGKAIKVTFTHAGSGLIIGKAPWVAPDSQPIPDTSLVGFTIAGADKNFVPAEAKIEGDTVVVSSPQVANPVAVRYDWANAPEGNLYNQEKLPASPFRTDDWPDPAMGQIIAATDKAVR